MSDNESIDRLARIEQRRWWQGSVIVDASLPEFDLEKPKPELWVVVSQACNIYNSSFELVPVIELVAARRIDECKSSNSRGDHPRILHVEARSTDKVIALELDIQTRRWLPRATLADLEAPEFRIMNADRVDGEPAMKGQWLEVLAGWMGRSYTRVALPNALNDALKDAKITSVLNDKLAKAKADELYGIYLSLGTDTEHEWSGVLGEMPPPYTLGIVVVTFPDIDPLPFQERLIKQLFEDEVEDPSDKSKKITRADLVKRYNVRIIKQDIEGRTVTDVYLSEIMTYVRYSLVDGLSVSSMAVPH